MLLSAPPPCELIQVNFMYFFILSMQLAFQFVGKKIISYYALIQERKHTHTHTHTRPCTHTHSHARPHTDTHTRTQLCTHTHTLGVSLLACEAMMSVITLSSSLQASTLTSIIF